MADALDLITLRLKGIQAAIGRLPADAKTNPVSSTMGENFNRLLAEAEEILPDQLANALPQAVDFDRTFDLATATHFDLDAFCEQILGLISLAEERE